MLLKIVCLYIVVVCVFAAPPTDVVPLEKRQPTVIPILEQSEELEPNGTYKFSYETGNGIKREEISYDKVLPRTRSAATGSDNEEQSDENNEIHVQQGSYSYSAPDGTLITVRYIADENGFQPIGDHLPKPPSILIAASSARISGRRSKNDDNVEGGSAPAAAIATAPAASAPSKASKALEAPELESKIAEISSAQIPASTPEAAQQSTILEASSPKLESRIGELVSAVKASTPTQESSQDSSTTPEAPSTTEVTSTTESISTTTELLSTEVTSTEQPTISEAASTPETSSELSTSEGPSSTTVVPTTNTTPADTTPNSEATTEAASTLSA